MNPMIRDSMLGWPGLLSTPRSPPPPKQWPPRVEWVNANEIPSSDTKHYACPLDLLVLICVNEALKTARGSLPVSPFRRCLRLLQRPQ